jgi:hypothetical protein
MGFTPQFPLPKKDLGSVVSPSTTRPGRKSLCPFGPGDLVLAENKRVRFFRGACHIAVPRGTVRHSMGGSLLSFCL